MSLRRLPAESSWAPPGGGMQLPQHVHDHPRCTGRGPRDPEQGYPCGPRHSWPHTGVHNVSVTPARDAFGSSPAPVSLLTRRFDLSPTNVAISVACLPGARHRFTPVVSDGARRRHLTRFE